MGTNKLAAGLFEELLDGLELAREHLEYTGYGDSWERECAYSEGLPEKLDALITKARGVVL